MAIGFRSSAEPPLLLQRCSQLGTDWRGVRFRRLIGCAWQDLQRESEIGSIGSAFWFFLARLSAAGVALLGLVDRNWEEALLGAVVFCLPVWLIRHWRQGHSV